MGALRFRKGKDGEPIECKETTIVDLSMADSFITRGGLWVVGQSILMIGVVVLGVLFHGQWHNRAGIVIGAGLFMLGGVVGVAGVRALGTNRTPFPKPLDAATLVQHGIYGLVRHPLYSSVILASFG